MLTDRAVFGKWLPRKPAFAAVFLLFLGLQAAAQGSLPKPPHNRFANTLTGNWLVQQPDSSLAPLNPADAAGVTTLHQWVHFRPDRPFVISFNSRPNLSLFLNNRLVFRASNGGEFSLDLTKLYKPAEPGQVLLTISHPTELPAYWTYQQAFTSANQVKTGTAQLPVRLPKPEADDHVYILCLLGLGFLYGFLRISYPTDWAAIYNPTFFTRLSSEETFYKKPAGSVSSFMFLLAFAVSMSLATIAVQRNLQETITLGRVFQDSQSGVFSSIALGTIVVLVAILLKLVFLELVAFVFNYRRLVPLQYREFIRSSLLFGIGLPVVLVLYLSFGQEGQARLGVVANGLLMLLLTVPMVRVLYLIGSRYQLADVQLFCYLCATEIIPLAIILKIIFLSY